MRPIKAHGLSHSGAMAQSMQRRVGGFDAQDNRSRLVQRLPGAWFCSACHQRQFTVFTVLASRFGAHFFWVFFFLRGKKSTSLSGET